MRPPSFGYYADYVQHPPLRPPSSICSTNVSTAVRAAPWDKFMGQNIKFHDKSQTTSQTGSSVVSKGTPSTSQPAQLLGKLQSGQEVSVQSFVDECQAGSSCISKDTTGTSQAANLLRKLHPSNEVPLHSPMDEGHAGSSVLSKSAVGTSQAANLLQKLQPNHAATSQSQAGESPAIKSPEKSSTIVSASVPKSGIASTFDSSPNKPDLSVGTKGMPSLPEQPLACNSEAGPQDKMPDSMGNATGASASLAVGAQSDANAPEVAASLGLPATRSKPTRELKSVLSVSAEPKSAAGMALNQMMPKSNRAKHGSTDSSAADRKSALSVSGPMTSSAAMALGSLSKVNTKRTSGSNSVERSNTDNKSESVVLSTSDARNAQDETVGTNAVPKPKKAAGRSRGPDAKSVISGLNSSSSASALLGPMLQGAPKKRSARPQGADAASVIA
jgi:hypothetical protein